jgi:hypothetical protein
MLGWRYIVSGMIAMVAIAVALCTPTRAHAATPTFWEHNGSIVYLEADGAKREFYYQEPRPGLLQAGARPGSLLFSGRAIGNRYLGIAYIFSPQCGKYPYEVSGPILDNYERVVLNGQAPQLGADCRVRGYRQDRLEFTLLKSEYSAPVPSASLLPFEFTGVWATAHFGENQDENLCTRTDWRNRRNDRLIQITTSSIEMWESGCDILSVEPARSSVPGRKTIQVEAACSGEGMTWRSKDVLDVQSLQGKKVLMMTHVRTSNLRDDLGRRLPVDELAHPAMSLYWECE